MRDTAELLWCLAMFGSSGPAAEAAVTSLMKRFQFLARSEGMLSLPIPSLGFISFPFQIFWRQVAEA